MHFQFLHLIAAIIFLQSGPAPVTGTSGNITDKYIEEWKKFYPSIALDRGMHDAIFQLEDYSLVTIEKWIHYNKETLDQLNNLSWAEDNVDPVDGRLLKNQIKSELYKWEVLRPHESSILLYENIITNGIKDVLEANYLNSNEKVELITSRLYQILNICEQATQNLTKCNSKEFEISTNKLRDASHFYKMDLPMTIYNLSEERFEKTIALYNRVGLRLDGLLHHLNEGVPKIDFEQILGHKEFARRLASYTDSDMTPEALARDALREIQVVKGLMSKVADSYLSNNYEADRIPESFSDKLEMALMDMEGDVVKTGAEYLEFWRLLSDSIINFIDVHNIATLPEFQTLQIISAPESAGPAARIGWVSSAPPFAPNPITTLYLPSIPERLPIKEQEEFWASFNKPFNRFIVIHELFPGHYMQNKIARETPHPVRLLFPYGPYSEGWGTFVEKIVLDAGWERENPLTYLAHLRKRLENANRAYTSVMVHCFEWDQQKVLQFSAETSLLAPQFAKSLWGRLMRGPMQMTSYFIGGAAFKSLLEHEKNRLGEAFDLQLFMDTILRAGPIPINEFYKIYRAT